MCAGNQLAFHLNAVNLFPTNFPFIPMLYWIL